MRHDLGYPIIVSPFAQFVMTQAVLNVMGKERYATVPDEVRKYVLGYYGEIAGPIDPNLFDRIAKGAEPTKARPGDLIEPGIPRVRRERGPFASDDDLLLAAFYSDGQYKALKAAGPIKTDYPLAATPLVTLLKEIALRPSIRSFHLIQRPQLAAHDHTRHHHRRDHRRHSAQEGYAGRADHAERADRIDTRGLRGGSDRSPYSRPQCRQSRRVPIQPCLRKSAKASPSIVRA